MKKLSLLFILALVSISWTKPKVLIVTGQNNHNWKVSYLMLKDILDNTGEYESVDTILSPEQGGDMSTFKPDFAAYDAIVMDYNGDSWTQNTKDAFLKYLKKGGGLILYHAANNAFVEWEEFNKICALGGWGGRTEKNGPYVYLKDGKLVQDMTPGNGGSHGAAHSYPLNLHNEKHPVLKDIPQGAIHDSDELYDNMRGPGNIKELLVTAYADPKTGGSGKEEPLVFTVDYGKAKIVHIMLGHAGPTSQESPAIKCQYFQKILTNATRYVSGR